MNGNPLVEDCSRLIADRKWSIAFAESATAGSLSFAFSQTEYSGDILKGGLVCYNACIKEDILGITPELIEQYTPESPEVTREMAVRLKNLMKTEITVAITGLTTPGGSEQPGKPVGTMLYCILLQDTLIERKKIFTGSPVEIINLTLEQIAKTLIRALESLS